MIYLAKEIRWAGLLWIVLLFASCDKQEKEQPTVEIFSTAPSESLENFGAIQGQAAHSIRIDNGKAMLRTYRLAQGKKTLEYEYLLDSNKHRMIWIAPSLEEDNVRIDLGFYESNGTGSDYGAFTHFEIKQPYLVGSNLDFRSIEVEDREQSLVHYWILNEETESTNSTLVDNQAALLKTSSEKNVEFLLFTISAN